MKNLYTLFIATMLSISAMAQIPNYVPTNGLVAYYSFNGNANDESGNGNNGTVYGATLTTDSFGNSNSAYYFNGSNNYIDFGNVGIFNSITNFTFEGNFNLNASSNWCTLFSKGAWNSAFSNPGWAILVNSANLNLYMEGSLLSSTNVSLTLNTWYHFAITRNNDTIKTYVNGTLLNTVINGTVPTANTNSFKIGKNDGFNPGNSYPYPYYFNGKIDDMGVWNRALSASEITTLYNATPCYTPTPQTNNVTLSNPGTATLTATGGANYKWYNVPTGGTALGTSATFTTPVVNTCDTFYVSNTTTCESARVPAIVSVVNIITGLVATYPFNGNANDSSGNGNNGTVHGANLTTDRFGNASKAYNFNGTSNYIDFGNPTLLKIGGALTYSAWVYLNGYTNHSGIMGRGKGANGSGQSAMASMLMIDPAGIAHFEISSGTSTSLLASNQTLSLHQWYHVVGTWSGDTSVGGLKIYINGVLDSTGTSQITLITDVTQKLNLYYRPYFLKYIVL